MIRQSFHSIAVWKFHKALPQAIRFAAPGLYKQLNVPAAQRRRGGVTYGCTSAPQQRPPRVATTADQLRITVRRDPWTIWCFCLLRRDDGGRSLRPTASITSAATAARIADRTENTHARASRRSVASANEGWPLSAFITGVMAKGCCVKRARSMHWSRVGRCRVTKDSWPASATVMISK